MGRGWMQGIAVLLWMTYAVAVCLVLEFADWLVKKWRGRK